MALLIRDDDLKAHDAIGRSRLDWPEPLILETIQAAYDPAAGPDGTTDAVRLHARFLRALIDGDATHSSRLRIELLACCAARRIALQTIAAADEAVFDELMAIVQVRFRHSPGLREHFVQHLQDALGRLAKRAEPTRSAEAPRRLRFKSISRRPQGALAYTG